MKKRAKFKLQIFIGLSILLMVFTVPSRGQDSVPIHQQSQPGVSTTEDMDDFDREFGEDFVEESDKEEQSISVTDPLEPINRGFFWFNDKLYFYVLKPAAKVFRVVPKPARRSVRNFFSNLITPIRFGSALLQFKFKDAGTELGRLILNTTIGFGGLFDPAKKHFGMEKKDEDFGQVLGFYGLGPGFYIVWPFLGPSNLRDTAGIAGDTYMNPLYYRYINTNNELTTTERVVVLAVNQINTLSLDRDTYEKIKRESLDPYITIRNAYTQYREGMIKE